MKNSIEVVCMELGCRLTVHCEKNLFEYIKTTQGQGSVNRNISLHSFLLNHVHVNGAMLYVIVPVWVYVYFIKHYIHIYTNYVCASNLQIENSRSI